jgi:protoporphyrinogen oxidase
MSYEWIAERVPMPEMKDVIDGATKPREKKYGPNREFWYPVEGGIEALPRAFLHHIPEERIHLNVRVASIDGLHHEVILTDGRRIRYEWLISTIPLPALVNLLGESVGPEINSRAIGLKHNAVHTVNIGLEATDLGGERFMHWVYFPEKVKVIHHGFHTWAQASSLLQGHLYGIGAMFAKLLKSGRWPVMQVMLQLAWRWAFGQPAVDFGHRPPRWIRLQAFLQGLMTGLLTPVDKNRTHYLPRLMISTEAPDS